MNKDTRLIYEAYTLKGVAFGMDLESIAKKHGAEASEIRKEFEKGKAIEKEHTKDDSTAEKITKDHLFEDPCYYTKLAKMESENQETRAYAPSESEEESPEQYVKDSEKDYVSQKIKDENAEMPVKDFNKLKQHINKGPITIKKPTKELPYTDRYIRDLAKQDPREGQKEENAEDANTRNWVNIFHRTFGPGYKEEMEKGGLDPYEFFVDYYIAYLKNPEIVNKFAELYNTKYPTHKVDLDRLHKEIDKIKDKPLVGYKAPEK